MKSVVVETTKADTVAEASSAASHRVSWSNCQGQNPGLNTPSAVFSLLALEPCQKPPQWNLDLT